jgi:hypothetical protein
MARRGDQPPTPCGFFGFARPFPQEPFSVAVDWSMVNCSVCRRTTTRQDASARIRGQVIHMSPKTVINCHHEVKHRCLSWSECDHGKAGHECNLCVVYLAPGLLRTYRDADADLLAEIERRKQHAKHHVPMYRTLAELHASEAIEGTLASVGPAHLPKFYTFTASGWALLVPGSP